MEALHFVHYSICMCVPCVCVRVCMYVCMYRYVCYNGSIALETLVVLNNFREK